MKILQNQVCLVELSTERHERLFNHTPHHLVKGESFIDAGYPVKFMIGHFVFVDTGRVFLDFSHDLETQ